MTAQLEHMNITVSDPQKTAQLLCDLFGWHIRWEGEAISGGYTIHVGTASHYLAVYTGPGGRPQTKPHNSYLQQGGLNHVGVVVDDLDAIREKVAALGFTPGETFDYEPGLRFYFRDHDEIEWELVSYAS